MDWNDPVSNEGKYSCLFHKYCFFWFLLLTCFTSMFFSIYSLNNLLNSYSMPGIFPDARNIAMNNK